jgi:hypothetical protein
MKIIGYFLSYFIIFLATLAFAILQCTNCDGNDNWMVSSIILPEDTPKNEMEPSLTSPQLARFRNTEFNSSLLNRDDILAPDKKDSNPATSLFNISLEYIHVVPNPVKSGNSVTIAAFFGYSSSNPLTNKEADNPLPGTNESLITVNATIKNLVGSEVGKVDLEYLSGGNYVGIWKANVTAGIYNASIATLASGKSGLYSDVMQIEVI